MKRRLSSQMPSRELKYQKTKSFEKTTGVNSMTFNCVTTTVFQRTLRATGVFPRSQSGVAQGQVLRDFRDHINATDLSVDMFSTMCIVNADISRMTKTLKPKRGLTGKTYYLLEFGIILCFGLTELKAQLVWNENGEEKRGPATVMYELEELADD